MSRIFTVDIGNTAVKASIYEESKPLSTRVMESYDSAALSECVKKSRISGVAVCNVRGAEMDFSALTGGNSDIPVLELTSATPLPFEVVYATPSTLGVDRIAAAGGVMERYGGDVLVVDAGTAVTIDLVSGTRYLGGNISPGLRLRFRSLNAFTAKLPLVRPDGPLPERGEDTETAIRCGVVGGLVSEIASVYKDTRKKYKDITLVMTGGDADFIKPLLEEKGVDCRIDHDLVGLGLVSIYNYNRK